MNNLVTVNNGEITLEQEVIDKLVFCETQIAEAKKIQEEYKQAILQAMENNGVKKFECDALSITYVEPTTRDTIDSKTLKSELPDIYYSYCKTSNVKASVRLKIKE